VFGLQATTLFFSTLLRHPPGILRPPKSSYTGVLPALLSGVAKVHNPELQKLIALAKQQDEVHFANASAVLSMLTTILVSVANVLHERLSSEDPLPPEISDDPVVKKILNEANDAFRLLQGELKDPSPAPPSKQEPS